MTNVPAPLAALVGAKVRIETREGAVQYGKLTNIETFDTKVGDPAAPRVVPTVTKLILNNDPSEFADWHLVASITRA